MRHLLTQRLIGAMVLVSLAVIFLPMLLGESDDFGGIILSSNIPDEPRYEFSIAPVPDTATLASEVAAHSAVKIVEQDVDMDAGPAALNTGTAPAPAPVPAPAGAAPASAAVPRPAPAPAAEHTATSLQPRTETIAAWVVQVASMADKKRALALRDDLRAKQFTAYVESVTINNSVNYRVRIGPEADKDQADAMLKDLKARLNLTAIVLRY